MRKLCIICGGPSPERGISLNSARSILDHVSSPHIDVSMLYVDRKLTFHQLDPYQAYSNTPADFDYLLSGGRQALTDDALTAFLHTHDMVFPAIHGVFGEDGTLQQLLEDKGVPFVGSGAEACRTLFPKHTASQVLGKAGRITLPQYAVQAEAINSTAIQAFFADHAISKAVVKPAVSGSSIGVTVVHTAAEAETAAKTLFAQGLDTTAVIEPFCEGVEFTVVVLTSPDGVPIALIPSEITIPYETGQIFDYRRKYLPTNAVHYRCPPNFSDKDIATIRGQAEGIFSLFKMQDFARLDGWRLNDGRIVFTDLNPISGMEQNSFLFQQAARVGLSHHDTLLTVINSACRRQDVESFPMEAQADQGDQLVYVLFGGETSERQVSVMSGTNVWLKLRQSRMYRPFLFLLADDDTVWPVPYALALDHTVEEILHNLQNAVEHRLRTMPLRNEIRTWLRPVTAHADDDVFPTPMSLKQFISMACTENAFVFIGLHGGTGENGTLQHMLDDHRVPYNGAGPEAARIAMDKHLTAQALPAALAMPQMALSAVDMAFIDADALWTRLLQKFGTETLIIKPRSDGCSAGVVRLRSVADLASYIRLVTEGQTYAPAGTFTEQTSGIDLSVSRDGQFLLEPCIVTDRILITDTGLQHEDCGGWIELTTGVLEHAGLYHALTPSITVAEGDLLSVEEKFQGGTGVNLTPPPETLLSSKALTTLRTAAEEACRHISIRNYARVDQFYNRQSNEVRIIEINSLPALTPSTVIYHQALCETPPLSPCAFLEHLIQTASETETLTSAEQKRSGTKVVG